MNVVNEAKILRRFAQKMAGIGTMSTARTMDDIMPAADKRPVLAGGKGGDLALGSVNSPTPGGVELPAGDGYNPSAGGKQPIRPLLPRSGVRQHAEGTLADMAAAARPYYGKADAALSPYGISAGDALSGLGGAAVGGLGAMGLARLFRSKRDEEEGGTPWLAGLAGAGAGAVGLPLLLRYLASQGGAQTAAGPDAAANIIANA
jgi:hypothetical protein